MNTSDQREQRTNEEIDLELEYERVHKKRYEDFQEWLNKCPLVVTDYQDYTNEFVITFNLDRLMKTFIIQERFTGYADIHIEAETEDEAIALYNRGHYKDSQYFQDDFFYNYEFDSISEMEDLD